MALAADFGTEPSHRSANLVQLASGIGTGHAGATGNMREQCADVGVLGWGLLKDKMTNVKK